MSPEPSPQTDASPKKQPLIERLLKRPTLLLITPYLLGLIWTALHPLVSIVTGELKCRGIYIDENGLDVHRHRVESYPVGRLKAADRRLIARYNSSIIDTGMCDALDSWGVTGASVECLRHRPTNEVAFDVVKISPSIGPVVQSPEAIVLVINDAIIGDWYGESDLNASILHLIQRLGNKKDCPWLAKTVFVVSGIVCGMDNATNSADESSLQLDELVETFLSAYSGKQPIHETTAPITPLPPHFTNPLLRSVLVLSNIPTTDEPSTQQTEVRILPHGKKGTLPNLDLVFATAISFQSRDKSGYQARSMFYGDSEFRVHPFPEVETAVVNTMERFLNVISGDSIEKALGIKNNKMRKAFMQYAKDTGGLLGFMGASMLDKAAPHFPALERGIDSLTIELRVPPQAPTEVATSTPLIHTHFADTARVTEHLLRAISNLHERLHHSVAQYTLPSMSKFVSHGEYIFPAILVSLPMVARAAMLALRDVQRYRFKFVGTIMGSIGVSTALIYLWSGYHNKELEEHNNSFIDWAGVLVYLVVHLAVVLIARRTLRKEVSKWFKHSPRDDTGDILDEHQKSLRFVACLFGVYLHAPLLLSNYSLGLPSATFWSPLLAIFMFLPSSLAKHKIGLRVISYLAKIAVLIAFCPQFFLIRIFGTYNAYVTLVDTPLHLMLSALWLSA
jgi:glycosylphosphatidylinositol transamidase